MDIFIFEVLRLYELADCYDSVFWKVEEENIRFLANCSDWFYWATADAEEILPEDIPLLEACYHELRELDKEYYLSEYFSSVKRGMRPQNAAYKNMEPDLAILFDGCGPPRTQDILNPGKVRD